jgi:hypothetical protein
MNVSRHVVVALAWVVAGCGGATANASLACGPGRTALDGVCVKEQVADYVACVRAQGAQLASTSSNKLSLDASSLAMHATAASDVSAQLNKKYAVSDAATLSIIETCNKAAGFATVAVVTPGVAAPVAVTPGGWTLDAEGYSPDWAIHCRADGCISSGPGCDTTAVRGQCSFPRERAVELCKGHPQCVAVTCNLSRADCQARDVVTRAYMRGMKSKVVRAP